MQNPITETENGPTIESAQMLAEMLISQLAQLTKTSDPKARLFIEGARDTATVTRKQLEIAAVCK